MTAEAVYPYSHLFRLIPLLAAAAAAVCFALCARTRKFAFPAVFFVIGILSASAASDIYDGRLHAEYKGTLTASVASEIIVEDGRAEFYATDVSIGGEHVYGRGKVYVYTDGAPDFNAGDVIEIDGVFLPEEHTAFDSYFASSAIKGEYFAVYADNVRKLAEGDVSFPLGIQLAVKKLFYENMNGDTAAIAQALILGDKDGMDERLYSDVQASGLAHVLAVSGLHVTALASAAMWALRKLRLNAKAGFVIILALTFLYVMICSFTPSALRAFIMTAVLNFGAVFGLKKDSLSSLGLAALLIMTFSPFALMHVGFLLSVSSLFGIFAFAGPFVRFLMKGVDKIAPSVAADGVILPERGGAALIVSGGYAASDTPPVRFRVYDSLRRESYTVKEKPLRRLLIRVAELSSVAVAANLATFPFAAFFFGQVQTLFILSNVIILPYMMFIYILLLIITPIALIAPLHGIVGAFDVLLVPFRAFVSAVGSVSFSSLPVEASVVGVVCLCACTVLASRYVFLRRAERVVAVLSLFAVTAFAAALAQFLSTLS